jgi:uncharacterized protein YegP (UPF0339 family)
VTDVIVPFRDSSREHRWTYKHSNTNVMADSAEGYKNVEDLNQAIDTVFGGEPPVVLLPDGTYRQVPVDPALASALVLLSLVTGDEWTRDKLIRANDGLRESATTTLTRQGIVAEEAAAIVAERWDEMEDAKLPEALVAREEAETSVAANTGPIMDLSPGVAPTHAELRSKASERVAKWKADAKKDPTSEEAGSEEPTG